MLALGAFVGYFKLGGSIIKMLADKWKPPDQTMLGGITPAHFQIVERLCVGAIGLYLVELFSGDTSCNSPGMCGVVTRKFPPSLQILLDWHVAVWLVRVAWVGAFLWALLGVAMMRAHCFAGWEQNSCENAFAKLGQDVRVKHGLRAQKEHIMDKFGNPEERTQLWLVMKEFIPENGKVAKGQQQGKFQKKIREEFEKRGQVGLDDHYVEVKMFLDDLRTIFIEGQCVVMPEETPSAEDKKED